ncbi:MAG: FtsX-like permease family protein [Planctomycetota bacterium]|nr:FtsX-like permease family protein [Planctomycetota bacterium]
MYAALLANRYLTSRIIPLIAVAAVALCVALVVIVVSVMSGFLDKLRTSGRTMMGDVVVRYPISGIPYYDELIEKIEALPEAEVATPAIDTFGLIEMPYGTQEGNVVETVQVWGIDPVSFSRVSDFEDILWWQTPSPEKAGTLPPDDPRLSEGRDRKTDAMNMRDSMSDQPGIVLGMHLSVFNERQADGTYGFTNGMDQYWMPGKSVELTLVPIKGGKLSIDPEAREFVIVNEFQSGVFQIDKNRALISLADAQEMLRMASGDLYDNTAIDPETGGPKKIGTSPARATQVLVRTAEGHTPQQLRLAVMNAYESFWKTSRSVPGRLVQPPDPFAVTIMTWEQQLADIIGPVQKERELMRILFSIVYIVCAGLVLSIFWAIVYEKTRDIGILRAIGASRPGILGIFLIYGLVIGLLGSILGALLGWLVVSNINAIHDAMGEPAPIWLIVTTFAASGILLLVSIQAVIRGSILRWLLGVIGFLLLAAVGTGLLLHQGFLLWDPSVYYFESVPNETDWFTALLTMGGAVLFSVIGAAVPAARAADTDPVTALRYQ